MASINQMPFANPYLTAMEIYYVSIFALHFPLMQPENVNKSETAAIKRIKPLNNFLLSDKNFFISISYLSDINWNFSIQLSM